LTTACSWEMLKEKFNFKVLPFEERASSSTMRDHGKGTRFACARQSVAGMPPAPSLVSKNLPYTAEL
jgi:hypothetical protein